jgi:hypothetical protein
LDITNLLPVLTKMGNDLEEWREEWEKEWQEGKRDYNWKN